jgi:two-component system, NarL family, sensor kinase
LVLGQSDAGSTLAAVARFVAAGLIAAAVIAAGAYWVVSRNAVNEAIRNAQEVSAIDGRDIVAPALSDAVVAGDPAALDAFDAMVKERVLSSRVVRVKIWTTGGRIVYSDVRALVGEVFDLGANERAAIGQNRIAAEVSELGRPENRYERGYGKLLEVYLPIETASGQTFLFETYQVYSSIDQDQQRIWAAFFPVLLGGLTLLLAVQTPLAWRLASSLQRARGEREELLRRSLDISTAERRRIAGELHDGVVQSLAGVALSLAADAPRRDPRQTMRESAAVIRQAVRDLRTLIVDIAPPDLAGGRLEAALQDLLTPLAAQGVETDLKAEGLSAVDTQAGAVIYRAAQEAIRNATAHSGASRVEVAVSAGAGGVELSVSDNGRGFTAEEVLAQRRRGHVGIGLLRGLVEDAGGSLSLSSRPGEGTTLSVTLASAER